MYNVRLLLPFWSYRPPPEAVVVLEQIPSELM